MKGILKKSLILLLSGMLLTMAGCGNSEPVKSTDSSAGEENSTSAIRAEDSLSADFTYLLGNGVSTIFYDEYENNPIIEYFVSMEWDADGDGNGRTISLDFNTPPSGSESDYVNTLVSTGEYPDIMSVTFSSQSPGELYEDGMILDITEYVENYMPNYMAYIDRHPGLGDRMTNIIDGERRFIQLYMLDEEISEAWGGFLYRRDWILKYGTNPQTGETFSGEWVDNEWIDDVVFPSGNVDPIYISDWEWMFEIFASALEEQSITDGYAMSLFYSGQPLTGDLVCAFGGGNSDWYIDKETGDMMYGADSESFRTYLECMNTWYTNGWIDKAFAERSSDMFFMVDTPSVYSGKVGLWYGTQGSIGGGMDTSAGDTTNLTNGIVVMAAPQPINDVYGSDAVKNKEPYTYYSNSYLGTGVVITDKCADKDLPTLFTALDYLYSEEGSALKTLGFSNEQQAELQNEWYNEWGLEDGSYSITETEDGIRYLKNLAIIVDSQDLASACNLERTIGLNSKTRIDNGYPDFMQHSIDLWMLYDNSGNVGNEIIGQLTPDERSSGSLMQNNINTYISQAVPEFIMGKRDIYDDAQWEKYCEDVFAFDPNSYTQALQRVLKGE